MEGLFSPILLSAFGYDGSAQIAGGHMRILRRATPAAVSLGVVCLMTAVLWYLKMTGGGPRHPIFVYLLPIAVLAMFYGSLAALTCACEAMACAAYFLYDPIDSFAIASRLEVGDFVVFAVLAAIGVKCTRELLRPSAKPPTAPMRS
jgi:K+-sensing histidine kinase KdpD